MSSDIDALYDELSELHEAPKKQRQFTPEEERVIAGFAEISRFYEEHQRKPQHGEERDIFERLYAVRLDRIRAEPRYCKLLAEHGFDKYGLLPAGGEAEGTASVEALSDDELLVELEAGGIGGEAEEGEAESITRLVHVRPHNERAAAKAADEVAQYTPCPDFENFKQLLDKVQQELKSGIRKTTPFKKTAIELGEFFILRGHLVYVAEKGEETVFRGNEKQARLRVILDNGTECNILMRSLQRALYMDKMGRRISEPTAAALPLFGGEAEQGDRVNGRIYVLESLSEQPEIAAQKGLLHKIGVTGGEVKKRLINAAKDPTFLMAEVRIVREYELVNIQPVKLENIIHRFFAPAQADITIRDRFGAPIRPKEWFLVPLPAIDEMAARLRDGTLPAYRYDPAEARLIEG